MYGPSTIRLVYRDSILFEKVSTHQSVPVSINRYVSEGQLWILVWCQAMCDGVSLCSVLRTQGQQTRCHVDDQYCLYRDVFNPPSSFETVSLIICWRVGSCFCYVARIWSLSFFLFPLL